MDSQTRINIKSRKRHSCYRLSLRTNQHSKKEIKASRRKRQNLYRPKIYRTSSSLQRKEI